MTVLAATAWTSNAAMIADVARLGYIKTTDNVIDLTFGRGKWWKQWRPANLTGLTDRSDDHADQYAIDQVNVITNADYTNLDGIPDETYDVTVFDPPYVSVGGRGTSGIPDFVDRYGLVRAPRTPADLHANNLLGLKEAIRITKPGGTILVKCAPYISSGKRQDGDYWMRRDAADLGLTVHDVFIHVGHIRPQPSGRRQMHSRNNYSVLFVFHKPKHLK